LEKSFFHEGYRDVSRRHRLFIPCQDSRASIEITAERSRNVSSKLAGLLRPDEGTILEKLKEALRRAKTILHLHFSP
jgi:hypothetical protein